MTSGEKLQWIVEHCVSVSVECNEHRCSYEAVEDVLAEWKDVLDAETKAAMIASGNVVYVQVYSRTPIGFFRAFGADAESAIDAAYHKLKGGG
jgi:hypothetical protein